jgi:ribonuclease III
VERARRAALEERLGHQFRDEGLLERALTHSSYAHESPPAPHHESLALLGDAVLGLVVAEYLLGVAPSASVGELTQGRAQLVAEATLAGWARELDLGALLRLGRGEEQTGGRARQSNLATALEAILGVVHLEGGLPAVRTAVGRLALW